ncbi:putative aminotransferase family protein [Annulohypoxylon truncatum]|uniref:putative aminotransferase family protein n=1 Tax=Annulohypoxylon truncatum TaxID=327061 RepID=UPI002007F957|nr:putative aminotransferase family protein [Annulohypoxylon truncatum]KAI1208363.1 putative aminotransferase family protein [Annulohypoxylon truncatum]
MTIIYQPENADKPQPAAMTSPPSPSPSPLPQTPFGAAFRNRHFSFSPAYTPLNHGSYGAVPADVQAAHATLRAAVDEAPDPFIALRFHELLAPQRKLVARLLGLGADADELVFAPNATTASDTVLKNLRWEKGDVVLCYELVYESVDHGLAWLEEERGVEVCVVRVAWPVADEELVAAMVDAARKVNGEEGRRVRLAVVDTIVSMPGVRVPFERLVPALQAEGVLVLVDGAHGIGHIDIDLARLKPDFFVTNLHKWFFVPRGCAALYVPKRHQHLIRTTLPTGHRYRSRKTIGREGDDKGFVEMFDFVATDDTTAWLCVEAARNFRNDVCGGEAAIQVYCHRVAQESAAVAAEILGTSIMDCPGSCLRDCAFANVRLPLDIGTDGPGKVDPAHANKVSDWFKKTGYRENGIYFQTVLYRGVWWWRISGMIYVEVEDFRKGAEILKGLCERVRNGEHVKG